MIQKKTLVISAVNFSEGGALTVLKDLLTALQKRNTANFNIIALVHSKSYFPSFSKVTFLEFGWVKKSWLYRFYFEYFLSKKISLKYRPDAWVCLHDMTANVVCPKRYAYCHNPSMFFNGSPRTFLYDFKFFIFRYFYYFLYRINIYKNSWVFVQQNWIRSEFNKYFPTLDIAVSQPAVSILPPGKELSNHKKNNKKIIVFYPSLPRAFKNFEVAIKAFNNLDKRGFKESEICLLLTIDGTENRYAKKIFSMGKKNKLIKFIGLQTKEKINKLYDNSSILLFPSFLETWGLPITEAKTFNKPLLVADLPYAYETVGTYNKTVFFNPYSSDELTKLLIKFSESTLEFVKTETKKYNQPFLESWDETVNFIILDAKLDEKK